MRVRARNARLYLVEKEIGFECYRMARTAGLAPWGWCGIPPILNTGRCQRHATTALCPKTRSTENSCFPQNGWIQIRQTESLTMPFRLVGMTAMPWLSHPLQFVLVAVAGWINQQQRNVIDYLQEQNRVLREQLGPRRLRFTDDERRRLAAKARTLGRRVLREFASVVRRDTLLAWHRTLIAAQPRSTTAVLVVVRDGRRS
jgi:hypothetical protein